MRTPCAHRVQCAYRVATAAYPPRTAPGMTERAGALASRDTAGHHARQRAGVELNEVRTS